MRFVRRTVMVASLLATAGALAVVMLLASLHTDVGRAIVRDRLVPLLAQASGGRVTLGAVETPRLGTIVLRDLVLSLGGQSVLRTPRVEIELGLPLPVPATLRIRRLAIDGLTGHLVRRDGSFGETRAPSDGRGPGVSIDELTVRDARVGIVVAGGAAPRRVALRALSATLTLQARPDGTLDVSAFQLASGTTRADGRVHLDATRRVDLDLHAASLAPQLLAAIAPGVEWPAGTSLDLALEGPPHALALTTSLDLGAAGTVTARGRVDATTVPPAYRVAVEARDLVPGALRAGWPRERVQAAIRARGRRLHQVAHGRLVAESGRVAWRGRAFVGDGATLRVSASGEILDLARLTGGTAGRFPFRFELGSSGPLADPERGRLTMTVGRGTIGTTPIRQAAANARLDHGRIRVEGLRVDGDGIALRGDGRFDVARGALHADLELALAGRASAATTLALTRQGRGWVGHVLALRVAPVGLAAWTSEGPATLALGEGVRLGAVRLRSGTQRAVLSAEMGARTVLAGTLTLADAQLTPLCQLGGVTCAGVVAGRLEFSGIPTAPRLALTATAREVAAGPLARTTVEVDLRHERGRATGTITVASLGGTVVVTGTAPVPLPGTPPAPGELDVTITARKLSLARLPVWAPTMVRAADGRISADLHLGGTWAAPRPEGTLALQAPLLELVPSGAQWEDVHVVLRADGRSALAIEQLTATGGKGTLTGTGSFDFSAGIVPVADVRLRLDRFLAVDRPIVDASATGTLRVRGSLTAPIVRGRLYVPEGTVRPAFLPATNASTQPDPTIEVVGLPGRAPPTPAAGLGQLTLGVTLTLGDGMRIRRRDADIQLGGTLHVERTPPEALRVTGTVEVERGWYTFSNRRFTLRPSAVRFGGGPVGDAELDIEAARRTGEYDVTVAVQGTVAKPTLLLTSDPPLDEPDVLAVLLVGRPGGELSDTERLSVQSEAASLAVDYVVPGLSGALQEALPLEQVQVSPEAVRVGHRIGNDVFVSLSQQFVGWAGQTMAVEYAITPRLSVELSTSSRGSGAIDFFWRRRY